MARSWYVRKLEWWKHLKWCKRPQAKRERQASKKIVKESQE